MHSRISWLLVFVLSCGVLANGLDEDDHTHEVKSNLKFKHDEYGNIIGLYTYRGSPIENRRRFVEKRIRKHRRGRRPLVKKRKVYHDEYYPIGRRRLRSKSTSFADNDYGVVHTVIKKEKIYDDDNNKYTYEDSYGTQKVYKTKKVMIRRYPAKVKTWIPIQQRSGGIYNVRYVQTIKQPYIASHRTVRSWQILPNSNQQQRTYNVPNMWTNAGTAGGNTRILNPVSIWNTQQINTPTGSLGSVNTRSGGLVGNQFVAYGSPAIMNTRSLMNGNNVGTWQTRSGIFPSNNVMPAQSGVRTIMNYGVSLMNAQPRAMPVGNPRAASMPRSFLPSNNIQRTQNIMGAGYIRG